jgi:excisionase family DNA binding protein
VKNKPGTDPATLGTGKPPRKKRKKRNPPKPVNLAALGPLDPLRRYTRAQAAAYLCTSLPTIHKMLNDGELQSFKEGARRFIPGASIVAKSAPPK